MVVCIIYKYYCTVRKHGRVRGLGNFTEARGSIYLAQAHVRVSNYSLAVYPFNAHHSFHTTGGSLLGTLKQLAPKLTRLNDYLNVIKYLSCSLCFNSFCK